METAPVCSVLCHWKVLTGFMVQKLSLKLFGGEKSTWFVTHVLRLCGCNFSQACQVVKKLLHSLQLPNKIADIFYMFLCLHKKSLTIKLYSSAKHGRRTICLACRACTTSAPLLKVIKWVGVGWTYLAILWQQELILNPTCRLSADRCAVFLSGQEITHSVSILVSVSIWPLVPLISPLLCLLPVLCFLFCPAEPGAWIRPYKGLEHASLSSSFSGVFFAADVSIYVPCFPFLTNTSIHTQHIALSLSFPSGGPLLPQACINSLTYPDMFAVKPGQWGHLS